MKVTIEQIAAEAGVSRSTVSRAFTRPDLLKDATVTRIRSIATRLGYVPNHNARALSIGRTGALGIVVPDIANPFFPPLIRAAGARAARDDVAMLIASTEEDAEREAQAVTSVAARTDGIILASSRLAGAEIRRLAQRIRIVLVNRDVSGLRRVLVDTASGMSDAVAHLASLGHRRIAYLAGPPKSWSNTERRRAIRTTCAELGLELVEVSGYVPTYDEGRRATEELCLTGATATIAFDDILAQGIMAGLAERGASVPGDMSIVGCDDLLAATTYPPMTSVQARSAEAGERAVTMLLDGKDDSAVRVMLPGALIIRRTTAPPRA